MSEPEPEVTPEPITDDGDEHAPLVESEGDTDPDKDDDDA